MRVRKYVGLGWPLSVEYSYPHDPLSTCSYVYSWAIPDSNHLPSNRSLCLSALQPCNARSDAAFHQYITLGSVCSNSGVHSNTT